MGIDGRHDPRVRPGAEPILRTPAEEGPGAAATVRAHDIHGTRIDDAMSAGSESTATARGSHGKWGAQFWLLIL